MFGLLAGGASAALAWVVIGSLLRPVVPAWLWMGTWVALTLVVVAAELALRRLPLPQNPRQVPITIIDRGSREGAFQFGWEMGTGMRTFMPSVLPYLVLPYLLFGASAWQALLLGTAFGAGRAVMVVSRAYHSPDAAAWDDALRRHRSAFARGLAAVSGLCVLLGLAHQMV